MKASILAMFGLLALANAAPQYEPLTGSYSNCKVEWRTVKKAGYEEVTEYKEYTVYIDVCKTVYQTECKNVKVPKEVYVTECNTVGTDVCTDQWVCLDYPKPASLKQCNNKKWQPTGDCKKIYVDDCKDVQKTIYEYEEKCEQKQVQKCEDVPKIVKEEIHKRVPIQTERKIAYRVCPGQSDHEYTPIHTEAKVTILSNTNANGINGEVIFSQEEVNSPLKVSGTLKNLPPGLHGFHVHEKRHTGNDCSTAGGHFDPSKVRHLTYILCSIY